MNLRPVAWIPHHNCGEEWVRGLLHEDEMWNWSENGKWDRKSTKCQFYQRFMQSYAYRSQKRKKIQFSHQYLFTLLGSVCVKDVRRTLMKLGPRRSAAWNRSPELPSETNLKSNLFLVTIKLKNNVSLSNLVLPLVGWLSEYNRATKYET